MSNRLAEEREIQNRYGEQAAGGVAGVVALVLGGRATNLRSRLRK